MSRAKDSGSQDVPEPAETARRCGLAYVDPEQPGISRRRRGRGFSYSGPRGGLIRDDGVRQRLADLAVPPAWEDVWICPNPDGHLQAVGRDEAGRRQYLYHEQFRAAREKLKYQRLRPFGERLPGLRRRVGRDLARPHLPREKVTAAAVRVLDLAAIRVGNPQYERTNGTYGLVTLRRRHIELGRSETRLHFSGKGGRDIEVELADRDLAEVLRECDELPGYRLFQYVDEDGDKRELGVAELNDYIRDALGEQFSAKDFRTWAGTSTAITALAARTPGRDEAERRSILVEIAEQVGERLHNTPTVARESYIHPCIESLYLDGRFHEILKRARNKESNFETPGRRRDERLTLAFLAAADA